MTYFNKILVKKNKVVEPVQLVKKQNIPHILRIKVWNKWIGEEIGKTKCLCCKSTDITQMSFHCGHVIAEVNGGELIVSNLRPICQNCNSSMGTKNMIDFMKSFQTKNKYFREIQRSNKYSTAGFFKED